jgi:hypothetical protein
VQPLFDPDLHNLVGKRCVAIVYDSDISINTEGDPYLHPEPTDNWRDKAQSDTIR